MASGKRRRKLGRWWRVALVVLAVGVAITWWLRRETPLETRFNGAYRLDDGRLVIVTPRAGDTLRYRFMDGTSGALRPVDELTFEAGPGWSEREPVEVVARFDLGSGARPVGLSWTSDDGEQRGRREILPEVPGTIQSGDLALRAKLVLPSGSGPFPAVVFVHGSGDESAVDSYFNPYQMAAQGIAGLVFDKRGTGESEGTYNQNFHLLSDDVVAAVEWLRGRPEVDPSNIHLAGYSQGGWIAPLAASKIEVRSVLIAYGPLVPVTGEDRWGYVYGLREAGFGEAEIRQVDAIAEIVGGIMDHGQNRWAELKTALEAAEDEAWFEAVRGSDSVVGVLASLPVPMWMVRSYFSWKFRGDVPFIDRLYDPVPTVASLQVPSLWIFGGEDSSMPTQWSIDGLEALQSEGRPIEIEVFPQAEHGILLFDERDGERTYRSYAPGYLGLQVSWLRRQAGLDAAPDPPLDSGL